MKQMHGKSSHDKFGNLVAMPFTVIGDESKKLIEVLPCSSDDQHVADDHLF